VLIASKRRDLARARGATAALYLAPPVEQNFTNRGTTTNFALHYERDISADDRIGVASLSIPARLAKMAEHPEARRDAA